MKKNIFHPGFLHHKIATILKQHKSETILDMGGTGRLKQYHNGDITDVNIKHGINALNTGYKDKSFDSCISIATLEHIEIDNQKKFIQESIRLSRFSSVHWFPYGHHAQLTENIKNSHGHKHPCSLPNENIIKFIKNNNKVFKIESFITVSEHLFFLGTFKDSLNTVKIYDFINKYGKYPYGILVEIKKSL